MSIAAQTRQVTDWKWEKQELIVEVADTHHTDHKKYHLDLPGIYQTKNLLTVLEACHQLRQAGWDIDEEKIHPALQQVKKLTGLHGRWEVIHHSPKVVLDVAHNIDGIKQLLQQIELTEHNQLHLIMGMVKDKEIDDILSVLPKEAQYYFTKAQIPRALPEEELLKKAERYRLKGKAFSTVNTALYAAAINADKKDLIVVCGSIFLVGEISLKGVYGIWGDDRNATIVSGFLEMLGGIG